MTYQPPPPYWTPPPRKRRFGLALLLGVVGALTIAGAAVGITLAVTQYDKAPAVRTVPPRGRPPEDIGHQAGTKPVQVREAGLARSFGQPYRVA